MFSFSMFFKCCSNFDSNESSIHNGHKTTKDRANEDEEGYGHTQKLSSVAEVMPKITSYNVTAEEKESESNPTLHRKSKFGLPGITPMPTSSKVTTTRCLITYACRHSNNHCSKHPRC